MTQKIYKYLILGAGPSGLTFAHALLDRGCNPNDILILEKNTTVGGLCRSEIIDGSPIDIGGGHFLDIRRTDVLEFIFRFMPREEWNIFSRISKIHLYDNEIDYPLEANIWQLPIEIQADFLESIAQAGCVQGKNIPQTFQEWISWKLGERIATQYMLPYNKKIWSIELSHLGIYWLNKLPSVSFRETLLSCLEKKPCGLIPAHGKFLYPKKFGYGEVWRRMGEKLGTSLLTNCPIEHIDIKRRIINHRWQAETLISTIPWPQWSDFCDLPHSITDSFTSLRNASVDIAYFSNTIKSLAHWIYEPDESISFHRLLLRNNFIAGAHGYWTETNSCRSQEANDICFHNAFAYPIPTHEKPRAISAILDWAKSNNIYGLGRWGRWEHINSDLAVAEAIQLAEMLNYEKSE